MGTQPSDKAKRLAPKLIAVGSEWGANAAFAASTSAIVAGNAAGGALWIGIHAAFLMAKNWSLGVTAAEGQAAVEELLKDLIGKHNSLQGALDALATDQHIHELISRERVTELQSILRGSSAEIEKRVAENQEVTFHLARYLESWCSDKDVTLDDILQHVSSLSAQIATGFRETQSQGAAILKAVTEIKAQRGIRPITPGSLPSVVDLNVLAFRPLDNACRFDGLEPAELTALQDTIRTAMLNASQPLLNWKTTVGAGHRRLTPAVEGTVREALQRESSTNLILGPKGSGKSAVSAVISQWALANGFVVLCIRADQLPADASSAAGLQRFLNLPISVEDGVRVAAQKYKVLVVLDQLDAISELTDRRTNRLNLLLNLIRGLSGVNSVHLLAACREFDYRHDARLSTIDVEPLKLTVPEWTNIAEVLRAEGRAAETMAPSLQELLRTPWHLNLFLQVAEQGQEFASLQSLVEAVWNKCVINSDGLPGRIALMERIALRMSDNEELFVPSSVADALPAERDALLRDEILVADSGGRRLSFRHQTFYDFALARLFARGDKLLSTYVIERQDGLFVRPTMLNALEMLRESSRSTYHREVSQILEAKPRLHLRKLLLEFIARQSEPDDEEAAVLLPLVESDDGPLILSAAAGSHGWFTRLRDSGKLSSWMKQPSQRAALSFGLLLDASKFDPASVYRLVASCWGPNAEYNQLVLALVYRLPILDDDWMRLACQAAGRSGHPIVFTASRIAETNPEYAVRLICSQFEYEYCQAEREAAASPPARDEADGLNASRFLAAQRDPFVLLITGTNTNDRYGLDAIAEKAPKAFVEGLWSWFTNVLNKMPERNGARGVRYKEDYVTHRAYGVLPIPLVQALHTATDKWAAADPSAFALFVERAATSEHLAVHRILAQGLGIIAERCPAAIVTYLTADPRRLAIGTWRSELGISRKLISAVFPYLAATERKNLEEAIVRFDAFSPEEYSGCDRETRFKLKKWSREDRLRLLRAIPASFLSAEARALKENEEVQLPGVAAVESPFTEIRPSAAPMTPDVIQKAKDHDVLRLMDRLVAYEKQISPNNVRRRSDFARGGGIIEEAWALRSAAEANPERVVKLIPNLIPDRHDHQLYAGLAMEGLAKSKLDAGKLFSLLSDLDARGFDGDDFREHAASAIEERARRSDPAPAALVEKMVSWMTEVATPDPKDETDDDNAGTELTSLVWDHGAGGMLMHGRGAIFRAIAQSCDCEGRTDVRTLIAAARQRIGKERHPRVAAEMLVYLHNAFTRKEAIAGATSIFGGLIMGCPAALHQDMAISALGALTGYFDPPELYQRWLTDLSRSPRPRSRQAFGELLFLYHCRQQTQWGNDQLSKALGADDDATIRGTAFGAARTWTEPHCRKRATDVLCAAATRSTKDFTQIVESAFFLIEDEPFPIDAETHRVIRIVCDNPPMLRAAGPQMLEALAPVAGTQPDVVLAASRALLAVIVEDVQQLAGPLATTAASLTSIAITLHRQNTYRAQGLALFESLLELGIGEAAAALELLDRKPYVKPMFALPAVRRRRRRR